MSEIKDIIDRYIDDNLSNKKIYSVVGEVSEVDEDTLTCTVEPSNGDAKRFNVKLQASKGDGFVVIPKDGTKAILTYINKDNGYLTHVQEAEKILISSVLTQFNDGSNDGLVLLNPLLSKINSLEDEINQLKSIFTSWIVVPTDGGGALKIAATSWAAQPIIPTQKTEIENEDIIQ